MGCWLGCGEHPPAMLGGGCLSWGWGYRWELSALRPAAGASLLGAAAV